MTTISKNEIENFCKIQLNGLSRKFNKKRFSFGSYMDSIEFINFLAKQAELNNHHPDMIVGWCKIKVSFTSHDKGGITNQCVEMAKYADYILEKLKFANTVIKIMVQIA